MALRVVDSSVFLEHYYEGYLSDRTCLESVDANTAIPQLVIGEVIGDLITTMRGERKPGGYEKLEDDEARVTTCRVSLNDFIERLGKYAIIRCTDEHWKIAVAQGSEGFGDLRRTGMKDRVILASSVKHGAEAFYHADPGIMGDEREIERISSRFSPLRKPVKLHYLGRHPPNASGTPEPVKPL